ncbi:phosphoribosylglycinamide formyltransferase 2, partial [Yersinia enterocolitica]
YHGLETALVGDTQIRLFGKPDIAGKRRLGVALAVADDTDTAIEVAKRAASAVVVTGK